MGKIADFFRSMGGPRADSDDRSPWGSFWFEPVTMRTVSGARISSESAMRLSAVYACVRILAESMASLPFILYRPGQGGGKVALRNHWLYRLFYIRPNQFQNPFEWREMLMGHLALRGNAFCRIVSNAKGEITDLIPIHPDRISLVLSQNSADEYSYRIIDRLGNQLVLPRGAVWHLRGLSSDGTVGVAFVCDGNGTGAAILPTAAQIAAIANFIDGLRPVTAHVTVYAPVAVPVNFTVEGLSPDTLAERRSVTAELADLLVREGQPGGTILLSHMRSAISAAAGEWDYVLITPAANIVMSAGQIPVMGSVTWL